MKKLLILTTLLIATLFFDCRKKEMGEYLLGDLKNQNPFTGYETLIYINSSGDSIVFNGDGRYSENIHSRPHSSNDEYYVNEQDLCSFIEQNNKYELTINLQTHLSNISEMYLHFTEVLNFDDATCTYWTSFDKLPLNQLPFQKGYYIDSLNVLNYYYYDIYVDSSLLTSGSSSYSCSNLNQATALFYTTTHGIIKIDFEDGDSWGLRNVEW